MTSENPQDDRRQPRTSVSAENQYPTDVLVSPDWVNARLDQFVTDDPDYRLLEVDVNPEFYDTAHVPGAAYVDWRADLRSAESHDILDSDEMASFLGAHGITEETTVVVYGDNSNWFAAHLYWQLTYYGHPDVRIMDGGREYWMDYNYPITTDPVDLSTVEYGKMREPLGRAEIRAYREGVRDALDTEAVFIDVRLPEEFRGDITKPPGINEGAVRGGHIPGATNVFWAKNIRPDGRFKSPDDLKEVYRSHGIELDDNVIVYCRIGERSSVTWFVLKELLRFEHVRNYDGSWTEWGNMIGVPIEVGD